MTNTTSLLEELKTLRSKMVDERRSTVAAMNKQDGAKEVHRVLLHLTEFIAAIDIAIADEKSLEP